VVVLSSSWLESIRRSLYGFINKATLISVPEESYYDLRGEEKETNLKEIAYYRIGRNSFAFLKGDVSEKIAENWRSQLDVYRFRRWKTQRDLLTYLKAIMIPLYFKKKGLFHMSWNACNTQLLKRYVVYGIDLERHRKFLCPSLVVDLENRYIFVREETVQKVREAHSQHDIFAYHTSTKAILDPLLFNVDVAGKEIDIIPVIGEFYEITVRRQKGVLVKLDKDTLLDEVNALLEDQEGKYIAALALAVVTTSDNPKYVYHAYYHGDSDPFWIQILRDYIETLRPQEMDATLVDIGESNKTIHKYYRTFLLEIGLRFEMDLQNSIKG